MNTMPTDRRTAVARFDAVEADLHRPFEMDASQGAAGHCKIMAVRVANPEGQGTGGPLGAIMGALVGILGG